MSISLVSLETLCFIWAIAQLLGLVVGTLLIVLGIILLRQPIKIRDS